MAGDYSLTWSAFNGGLRVLAIRYSIEEAIRIHCAPNDAQDVPPAPAPNLAIPNDVSNVNKLPQACVMDKELRTIRLCLVQTFKYYDQLRV